MKMDKKIVHKFTKPPRCVCQSAPFKSFNRKRPRFTMLSNVIFISLIFLIIYISTKLPHGHSDYQWKWPTARILYKLFQKQLVYKACSMFTQCYKLVACFTVELTTSEGRHALNLIYNFTADFLINCSGVQNPSFH